MANESNLVPNEARTPEERRRNAQKAGRASGESRRRKRQLRDCLNTLLELPPSGKHASALSMMGVEAEDMDNRMLIMAALVAKAASGDVAAIREVRCISEETDKAREAEQKQRAELLKSQTEKLKAEEGQTADTLKKLDELIRGIDHEAKADPKAKGILD